MGPSSASHSPSTAVTHCMYSCNQRVGVGVGVRVRVGVGVS